MPQREIQEIGYRPLAWNGQAAWARQEVLSAGPRCLCGMNHGELNKPMPDQ